MLNMFPTVTSKKLKHREKGQDTEQRLTMQVPFVPAAAFVALSLAAH